MQHDWRDFEKFHVVRRLRSLIGAWWGVQVNFADSDGTLRGVEKGAFFKPLRHGCVAVCTAKAGITACIKNIAKTRDTKTGGLSFCHAGFSFLSTAIIVDGEHIGTVIGDGFIHEGTAENQKERIKAYLREQNNLSEQKIKECIEEIPVLSDRDIQYIGELFKVVVEEIVAAKAALQKSDDEIVSLRREVAEKYSFHKMIGSSPKMQELYKLLERVADSPASVLVQGENGTGKELIARALHFTSKRASERFIAVNCGAFNESLLESELFGHVKGAFTGALSEKEGVFASANGGTLFLDEVGEMSQAMQVKLLRVLQDGTYIPVGSTKTKSAQVRIVCATNRDLVKMISAGSFRQDLYYRLNVINITLPPLRERKSDIPLLAEHFLAQEKNALDGKKKKLHDAALKRLIDYEWPGNIRELENEIERAVLLSGRDDCIGAESFSIKINSSSVAPLRSLGGGRLKDAVEELERHMIAEGLRRNGWNKSQLAKELGISRANLIAKVEKYGLEKRRAS